MLQGVLVVASEMSGWPSSEAQVVDARGGAPSRSARIRISENRKNGVRRISGTRSKVSQPEAVARLISKAARGSTAMAHA